MGVNGFRQYYYTRLVMYLVSPFAIRSKIPLTSIILLLLTLQLGQQCTMLPAFALYSNGLC